MASKIQIRRGTAAQWTSANPVLIVGELGFETDTNLLKAGDGTTAWTSLAYYRGQPVQTVDVQTFDSSGTWTKPAGAVTTTIQLCGGGAGGGLGNAGTGGDGGAAGEPFLISVASSTLSATESVTIGAGGVIATVGNTTTFNKFFAMRGGGTGLQSIRNAHKQDIPLSASSYHGAGINLGGNGYRNPLGAGGGGAGANAVNAAGGTSGGSSAERPIVYGSPGLATQGGGVAGGATGNPGANGSTGVTDAHGFGSGGSGGGAAATGFNNALGGNGGNGIRGSGGGGGGRGGSTSIGNSNGGGGGNGFAIITTVCYS